MTDADWFTVANFDGCAGTGQCSALEFFEPEWIRLKPIQWTLGGSRIGGEEARKPTIEGETVHCISEGIGVRISLRWTAAEVPRRRSAHDGRKRATAPGLRFGTDSIARRGTM